MTPTQEKYLLVIDKLSKDKKLVRNRQVADILEVKPSSVTEIMDRLVNQNMIQHISYQGVFGMATVFLTNFIRCRTSFRMLFRLSLTMSLLGCDDLRQELTVKV
ncbi:metal-dependent transcriptional regulator, partial [Enterococcus durans]|nr:hypothetical protein [Enterococcus durans]MZI52406.1 hypothetical protein [Enterococcus durans]NAA98234.1 hypothetical protein [Enterococcus durans]